MSRVERILAGESHANVLTQNEVAELFAKGIDGKHATHYRSDRGILWHYGTIEGVRTIDDAVIANTQCWSTGFARCSITGVDYYLPLSTISGILRWGSEAEITKIKVIDTKETQFWHDDTLFSLNAGRHFLFGTDDDHPYLVELPKACNTVEEAHEAMRPSHTDASTPRQGDLFFVPVKSEPKGQLKKTHYQKLLKFAGNYDFEYDVRERAFGPDARIRLPWMPNPELEAQRREAGENIYVGIIDKIYREIERPTIMGTRHMAQELITTDDGLTFVRGNITHPEHKKCVLKSWHLVRMNEAKQSLRVTRRGDGGDGAD